MATITGMNLSSCSSMVLTVKGPNSNSSLPQKVQSLRFPLLFKQNHISLSTTHWNVRAAPDSSSISEKVEESIKNAEEACSGDPVSGECVAAWDEVEELSAAASHARDKKKDSDPLDAYCKDNPESEECRTYDN